MRHEGAVFRRDTQHCQSAVDASSERGQGLRIFDSGPQHYPCLRVEIPTQPTKADVNPVVNGNATERLDYGLNFFCGRTTDKFKCHVKILSWNPSHRGIDRRKTISYVGEV